MPRLEELVGRLLDDEKIEDVRWTLKASLEQLDMK